MREVINLKQINFKTLDECIECYGRGNLVAIDTLSQTIFYTRHGCQPKFVCESENRAGRVTFWFLKPETSYVYKLWQDSNPKKNLDEKPRENI